MKYGLINRGITRHGTTVRMMIIGFLNGNVPIDEHGNPLMWRSQYETEMTVCEYGGGFIAITKTHLTEKQRERLTKILLKLI